MRTLLVHPSNIPLERKAEKEITFVTDHTMPLGICYLASVLQEKNYDVNLFDHSANNMPIPEFAKWIVKRDFDVIGFPSSVRNVLLADHLPSEKHSDTGTCPP